MSRPPRSTLELSSKKRALLDLLLREEGISPSRNETISRRPSGVSIPLSFAQERLWYLDQLEPSSPLYNVSRALRFTGPLNIESLRRALDVIVSRHEVLRTTFAASDGVPVQVIGENRLIDLREVDLTQMSATERQGESQRLIQEETRRPFNLTSDLMLRTTLLKLGREEHILLLVIHHIASDAWSTGVFLRELTLLYDAFSTGKSSPLIELPIQYADFAIWQRQWAQGEVWAGHLAYWKQRHAGAPQCLDLPTDRPRPAVSRHLGAHESVVLTEALSTALRTLSRRDGVTLFMVLLAAFKVLLQRHTGQDDIVVGSPIGGRNRLETEGLIGFFINALVLRTDLSGSPKFRELLARVRESCVGAYTHQDIPFEKLVEELHPARESSRSPLFQILFDMLNLPDIGTGQLRGLKVENMPRPRTAAKYDLTLFAMEKRPQIRLQLLYDTELFSQKRIAELLAQYRYLLEQVVENPDRTINDYSLVTSTAKRLLPDPTMPLDDSWYGAVHELFADFAQKQPDKLAVEDSSESWTYRELNEHANQLAHYLIAQGLQREDIVAIYAHRNAHLVWALMGVLKAGAAFCVIDPSHPPARVKEYLSATAPKALIEIGGAGEPNAEMEEVLRSDSLRCRITLPGKSSADASPFLAPYAKNNPAVAVGADDLAYVIFTSGSTGKPKGVMGRHGPLTHFLPWVRETFGLAENDRFSLLAGLSSNILQREIFTALSLGGTLDIPQPDAIGSPGGLDEWMRQKGVSIVHLTPAMAQLLDSSARQGIPSVRRVFFTGDLLKKPDVGRARKLMPQAEIVNFYNSSETQRGGSYTIVSGGQIENEKDIPSLGRGVKDVQLLVLNSSRQLAGVGEIGEIFVRSPHLAKGYLNDEQLTQERFMINPFTGRPADRLYKTAELGRYFPDGNVQWIGRIDRQVNIRGFRIELGEVEAILRDHPAVQETVVMAREDQPGEKRLVAYVVLIKGREATVNDLRSLLRRKLPEFTIPTSLVFLDSLPLTPNGKTDFSALPLPNPASAASQSRFVAPRTPLESLIAEIWKDVLGVDRVGVYDNFFDLGGHSLLSMQAIARLENQTGLKMNPKAFVTQTLGQLASVYERRLPPHAQVRPKSFTRRLWNTLKSAVFPARNDGP